MVLAITQRHTPRMDTLDKSVLAINNTRKMPVGRVVDQDETSYCGRGQERCRPKQEMDGEKSERACMRQAS